MKKLEQRVPNLRFKGFTNDWEQHKLGEIITYYNGKSHEEQFRNAETQNFELVTLKSIDENGNLCSSEKYIDSTNNTLSKNDLIMVLSEQNKGLVGMTTLIPRDNYYVLNQRVALLKLHKNNSPFFLTDAINQHQIFFERMSAGTKVQNISKSNVENFNLYIPNYSEQKEVGHIIALCQNIITLQQRKLALLKQLKKGLLQKMFAEKNSKQPILRFKGFHDDWEQRKLGEAVEITMGQSPSSKNYTENPNDHILVQGNADMKNGYVVPRVWTTQITKQAEKGDLILSVRAPVGDIGKTDYDVVLGRGVAAIKGNSFIFQLLTKMKINGYWTRFSTGSTFESINSDNIKNAQISIPSLREQEKIGGLFNEFDSLIVLHQRKQNHLKLLKKSLLQQMFI